MDRKYLVIKVGSTLPRLLAVTNGDFEDWVVRGLGLSAARGRVVDVAAAASEQTSAVLPATASDLAAEYCAVVIPGSHAMVSDRLPWSEATAQWIRDVLVPSGLPALGICYGHQLLCHALGGAVGNNPLGIEKGCCELTFTEDAAKDELARRVLCVEPKRGYVTHTQTILEPPPGLTVLAHSAMDRFHVVRFARSIWGV
jgi:GMP synthase (glutamine-hydrolysing)